MKRFWLALTLVFALVAGSQGMTGSPARAASTGQAFVDARLLQELSLTEEPLGVIVTFRSSGAPTEGQISLLQELGISTGVTFRALPMAGVLATAEQVQALAASPEVRSLFLNRTLVRENDGATAITGVDRLRTDSGLTSRNGGLPVSGRGIGVVINDSGVDGTHKDIEFGRNLVQNVMGNTNLNAQSALLPITYLENMATTDSTGGHGTHVAGIVGATGAMSGGKYEGVAPGANLVGYGTGAALVILDVLGAFDYALWHQAEYGIRVVTNSWGDTADSGTPFNPDDPINVATKACFDRNIVVVFSAGNSGPAEGTISGNYKKAPWVIAVAAGDKQGRLASFSSRGLEGNGGEVTVDGERFTWEDRPTVTAPGVEIISTRVVAPVSSLGAAEDVALIEPAHLPFYTTMSGTSMAAPHVAGIVALMLEANPALTPVQVKQILQETATNMPGRQAWEAGVGYVNAYAAVDQALAMRAYGSTLNMSRQFNSNALISTSREAWSATYDPVKGSSESITFTVPQGMTQLVAKAMVPGVLGQTGNTINLVLTAPDGTTQSSGVSVLFALYPDRAVTVNSPSPGTWKLQLKGVNGVALPETVQGSLAYKVDAGYTGLNDIEGHPAAPAIKVAVSERLIDGDSARNFRPNEYLTRRDLADYLTMGAGVRQYLPSDPSFADVKAADAPFAEAVSARGAALRDRNQSAGGVMRPTGDGTFSPNQAVRRAELAYSLVQSLGLGAEAQARNGTEVTVQVGSSRIAIEDADQIPAELRGYVQVALDLNILNAYFTTTQGAYDLQPVLHAHFEPQQKVTRADYAVAISRFFAAYLSE